MLIDNIRLDSWKKIVSAQYCSNLNVMFNVKSVSDLILNRRHNYLVKFVHCDNIVCGAVSLMVRRELAF